MPLFIPTSRARALDVLGSLQATEQDNYRDAEPGKIMHELRLGELAHFKLVPHTPYYGTADATPLYLIVLHAAWRSCGDAGLLERHLKTAERCLDWIDNYGDRDGDGFQEYATRSPVGYENQGWKDSGEAVVYPDGSLVKGPKALCELQGYVYDAWQRMAQVFDALGNQVALKIFGRKRLHYSVDSTKRSGMRNWGFTPTRWMATKNRFSASRRIPGIVCGRELSRLIALAGWSNV